jgi:hypothetical protein
MRKITLLAVAALMVVALAVPAFAAPSNKGTTYVAPSDVTISVLQGVTAPASLGDMGAAFGITGKPAAKGFNEGVIKHVGGLEIWFHARRDRDPQLLDRHQCRDRIR